MKRWQGLSAWGIVLLTLGLLLLGAWWVMQNVARPQTTVSIGGSAYKVDVARTAAQQQRGLGGRQSLGDGQGMLFVFAKDGPQPMWMKDMNIGLDMIWISSAKQVVHIEHDLAPDTYPQTFASPVAARYVLEIPAGAAARSSITLGKTATFDLP